ERLFERLRIVVGLEDVVRDGRERTARMEPRQLREDTQVRHRDVEFLRTAVRRGLGVRDFREYRVRSLIEPAARHRGRALRRRTSAEDALRRLCEALELPDVSAFVRRVLRERRAEAL